MKGILPDESFRKPKQGFSLNIVKWWSGGLGEEIRKTISDSEVVSKYFDSNALKSLMPTAGESYSYGFFTVAHLRLSRLARDICRRRSSKDW